MSIAPCGKRHFIRSLPVSILRRELALPSPTSISTQHREYQAFFFLPVGSFKLTNIVEHGKSDEYIIFFLRNRSSEKERVAEKIPLMEVRKCSRLLTPVIV